MWYVNSYFYCLYQWFLISYWIWLSWGLLHQCHLNRYFYCNIMHAGTSKFATDKVQSVDHRTMTAAISHGAAHRVTLAWCPSSNLVSRFIDAWSKWHPSIRQNAAHVSEIASNIYDSFIHHQMVIPHHVQPSSFFLQPKGLEITAGQFPVPRCQFQMRLEDYPFLILLKQE